jgi:hypothetical protein
MADISRVTNSNPKIRTTIVIFTSDYVSIVNSVPSLTGPYLKLQIEPTNNGKDIKALKIWYSNPNLIPQRLNEEINDEDIFRSLVYSMRGEGDSFVDRTTAYIRSIPREEASIIMKEYTKYIEDGTILDGLIAGVGAYMAFLLLNENGIFTNQMPFQFGAPYMVQSGNVVNRNMFQHLSLPFMSLSKVSQNMLLQLVLFIQSFINMWEPLFLDGPNIGVTNESRLCMEIISGFSQYVASSLAKTTLQQEAISKNLESIESRLYSHIDDALNIMRREVNNLIIDARNSIREITTNVNSQLNFVDDSIKDRITKAIESELDTQIKTKIQSEIEGSNERIRDIIRINVQEQGKDLVKILVDGKENELRKTIIGLEHRIEVLYDKFATDTVEKIPVTENNDIKGIPDAPITYDHISKQSGKSVGSDPITIRNNPQLSIDSVTPISDDSSHTKHGIYEEPKSVNIGRSVARENVNYNSNRSIATNNKSRDAPVSLVAWNKFQVDKNNK